MAKNTHSINLLPNNDNNLLTQFLNWSLTIGRLLIILTETIALATFLYRFGLDRQLIDLHDEIRKHSAIVKNYKEYEGLYRSLQARFALAKQYESQSGLTPRIFKDIIDLGRGIVTFKTLLVSNDVVKVEAQASSVNALSNFVTKLKSYSEITYVSVDRVENKTSDAVISIIVTAGLKNAPKPTPIPGAAQVQTMN